MALCGAVNPGLIGLVRMSDPMHRAKLLWIGPDLPSYAHLRPGREHTDMKTCTLIPLCRLGFYQPLHLPTCFKVGLVLDPQP
jgi:hypothetical protein